MQISYRKNTQFEETYVAYYARMKRFAKQYVIYEEDAENIVQDIFFEFWEKQLEFTSIVNINGFLLTILKNRCIDFLRRKTLIQKTVYEIQSEYYRTLRLKFDSLEIFDYKIFNEPDIDTIIQNAIDRLPEKCREIFVMNKIEGKKQKEIAQELNISVNTVESQMSIAYNKLKIALKDYAPILLFFFI